MNMVMRSLIHRCTRSLDEKSRYCFTLTSMTCVADPLPLVKVPLKSTLFQEEIRSRLPVCLNDAANRSVMYKMPSPIPLLLRPGVQRFPYTSSVTCPGCWLPRL
ncbi:hypothetical protein ABKN59_006679 [Abortiporus biennis]